MFILDVPYSGTVIIQNRASKRKILLYPQWKNSGRMAAALLQ